jgi:hypothetical protein
MTTDPDIPYRTKEVFRLRKEGRLEEALPLAAALHYEIAGDPWVTRAYAWCLYDEIKRLGKASDGPAFALAVQQLAELNIPADDNVLVQQVAFVLRSGSPEGQTLAQATRLSKECHHGEAVRLARPAAGAPGASRDALVAYGWILYRKLKGTDPVAELPQRIWCFEEFIRVWPCDWPADAMLAKCLLLEGMKNSENWPGLVAFVGALGLQELKSKDWVDERPEADFSPFQHQVLKALYQNLKHYAPLRRRWESLHRWLYAWEADLTGSDWPDYHFGRILAWTHGDRTKARLLLIKAVQRNPNEFWRWRALADAVEAEQVPAVLARAVACPCQDAQFKTGIYREFAEELAKAGLQSEAGASFQEFLRLLRLAGKEFNGPLPVWNQADNHQEKIDIQRFAEELGREADEVLLEALPEYLGFLICKLPPKEGKKGDVFLYYFDQLGVRSVKFKGASPPMDAPAISTRLRENSEGLSLAFAWSVAEVPSALGHQFDAFVNQPNPVKRLVPLMTRNFPFIPLHYDRWPAAAALKRGDCVSLRMVTDDKARPVVLGWEKLPEGMVIPGLMIEIVGEYQAVEGKPFGFINSGGQRIFVSPNDARNLSDRQFVSGVAIKSQDKLGRESWMYSNPT